MLFIHLATVSLNLVATYIYACYFIVHLPRRAAWNTLHFSVQVHAVCNCWTWVNPVLNS